MNENDFDIKTDREETDIDIDTDADRGTADAKARVARRRPQNAPQAAHPQQTPQARSVPVRPNANAPQNVPQTARPRSMPVRPNANAPQARSMPVQPNANAPQARSMPVRPNTNAPQARPMPVRPREDNTELPPQTNKLKTKSGSSVRLAVPPPKRRDKRPARSYDPIEDEEERAPARKRSRASVIAFRVCLVIVTVILVLLFGVVSLCRTLVLGPSETVRDLLVVSAMQASATKWIPGLFLGGDVVDQIMEKSREEQPLVIPMDALVGKNEGVDTAEPGGAPSTGGDPVPVDEWENAIDGMIYKTYSSSNFKAYILLVRDPSRVYVGTSSDFKSGKIGSRIFDIVEREDALAAINAGEFSDVGGTGTGDNPIGLTYSKGECVWNDNQRRTFIGFDNNGVLHAVENMTKAEADALGIRDAVSFQNGNVLITNDGNSVTLNYAEGNVGRSQRTAIGQRADGVVILVVTDGRTASSLGATRNDIIDLLLSEGAVTAGMLDGGSSTMMYYEDYYTKYNIDTSDFDEYQLEGLTNKYKAFTKPRHMPTFFLVSRGEGGANE